MRIGKKPKIHSSFELINSIELCIFEEVKKSGWKKEKEKVSLK